MPLIVRCTLVAWPAMWRLGLVTLAAAVLYWRTDFYPFVLVGSSALGLIIGTPWHTRKCYRRYRKHVAYFGWECVRTFIVPKSHIRCRAAAFKLICEAHEKQCRSH